MRNQLTSGTTIQKKISVSEIREMIANYMRSEGCSCCRGDRHAHNKNALAMALCVPKFDDDSGYDFDKFATKPNP